MDFITANNVRMIWKEMYFFWTAFVRQCQNIYRFDIDTGQMYGSSVWLAIVWLAKGKRFKLSLSNRYVETMELLAEHMLKYNQIQCLPIESTSSYLLTKVD